MYDNIIPIVKGINCQTQPLHYSEKKHAHKYLVNLFVPIIETFDLFRTVFILVVQTQVFLRNFIWFLLYWLQEKFYLFINQKWSVCTQVILSCWKFQFTFTKKNELIYISNKFWYFNLTKFQKQMNFNDSSTRELFKVLFILCQFILVNCTKL